MLMLMLMVRRSLGLRGELTMVQNTRRGETVNMAMAHFDKTRAYDVGVLSVVALDIVLVLMAVFHLGLLARAEFLVCVYVLCGSPYGLLKASL